MTIPAVERRPEAIMSPVARVGLELIDAARKGQRQRTRLLQATLRGLAPEAKARAR